MASRRALLISTLLVSCAVPREPVSKPTLVPTTELRALDSSKTALAGVLRGRPALVSLWATWCDACREELPALRELDAWTHDRGAVVVGVAVGETVATVSTFAAANGMSWPIVVDEEFHLADTLGEKRVPATLVVDAGGRIVFVGGAFDERAAAALKALVPTERPVAKVP